MESMIATAVETETCHRCGQQMEKLYESYETELYKCYGCRATMARNKYSQEESMVGIWRPEGTDPD